MVVWAHNPKKEEGMEERSGVLSEPKLHRQMKATREA